MVVSYRWCSSGNNFATKKPLNDNIATFLILFNCMWPLPHISYSIKTKSAAIIMYVLLIIVHHNNLYSKCSI